MSKKLIYIIVGILGIIFLTLLLSTSSPSKLVNYLNTQLNGELYEQMDSIESQRDILEKATKEYVRLYSNLEKERDLLVAEKGTLTKENEFLNEQLLGYDFMLDEVERPKELHEILK